MKNINAKDFFLSKGRAHISPGEALKILRELQGLSQTELADITNISQPNISALENGTRQIGRERALVLAKALHVHPAVILLPDFEIRRFVGVPSLLRAE